MTTLNTFPATASAEDIVASMEVESYAIVHDVLDGAALARVREDLAPHVGEPPRGTDDFTGHKTVRFGALLARLPMVREMVLQPLVHGVASACSGRCAPTSGSTTPASCT